MVARTGGQRQVGLRATLTRSCIAASGRGNGGPLEMAASSCTPRAPLGSDKEVELLQTYLASVALRMVRIFGPSGMEGSFCTTPSTAIRIMLGTCLPAVQR